MIEQTVATPDTTVPTTTNHNTNHSTISNNNNTNHTDDMNINISGALEDGELESDVLPNKTKYKSTVIYVNGGVNDSENEDHDTTGNVDDDENNHGDTTDNDIEQNDMNLLSLGVDAWDDSVLIDHWNNTIQQYKQFHPINKTHNSSSRTNNNNNGDNISNIDKHNGDSTVNNATARQLSNREKKRLRQQQYTDDRQQNKISKLLTHTKHQYTGTNKQSHTLLDCLNHDASVTRNNHNSTNSLCTDNSQLNSDISSNHADNNANIDDTQINQNQHNNSMNTLNSSNHVSSMTLEQSIIHNLNQSWYNVGYYTAQLDALHNNK